MYVTFRTRKWTLGASSRCPTVASSLARIEGPSEDPSCQVDHEKHQDDHHENCHHRHFCSFREGPPILSRRPRRGHHVNRRTPLSRESESAGCKGRDPAGFCLDDDRQRYQGSARGVTGFGVSQNPNTHGLSGVSARSRDRIPCLGRHLGKRIWGRVRDMSRNRRNRCFEKQADLQVKEAPLPGFEPGFPD